MENDFENQLCKDKTVPYMVCDNIYYLGFFISLKWKNTCEARGGNEVTPVGNYRQ